MNETRVFWDRCFCSLTDFHPVSNARLDPIILRLQQFRVGDLLDLGCGYGRWSIPLAQAGFRVHSADISEVAIKRLRSLAASLKLEIETTVCSSQFLPFATSSFDAIICNSVLDHMTVADATKTMREIVRVVKDGGVVYLTFDGEEDEPTDRYEVLPDGARYYTKGDQLRKIWRFFSDAEIQRLVHGSEIVEFLEKVNGVREIWIRALGDSLSH